MAYYVLIWVSLAAVGAEVLSMELVVFFLFLPPFLGMADGFSLVVGSVLIFISVCVPWSVTRSFEMKLQLQLDWTSTSLAILSKVSSQRCSPIVGWSIRECNFRSVGIVCSILLDCKQFSFHLILVKPILLAFGNIVGFEFSRWPEMVFMLSRLASCWSIKI